jgi:ABC-2 type transport system permease protein
MLTDIWTVVWKEWKELLAQRGNFSLRGGGLSLLFILLVFSIILPLQFGRGWIESPFLLFFVGWMSFVLVANAVTDAFAGERERHTLETLFASRLPDKAILLGKICAVISYAVASILVILVLQLVTLNIAYAGSGLLLYPAPIGLGSLVLSLLSAGLAANIGMLISSRATSVRQAQQMMSVIYMLVPFVLGYGVQLLPASWSSYFLELLADKNLTYIVWFAGGILAIVDIGSLFWILTRFSRVRLLSDR